MTYTFSLQTLQNFFLKDTQATFTNCQAAAHALRAVCPSNCSVFCEQEKVKIWIDQQNSWLIPEEIQKLAKNVYEDRDYTPRTYFKRGPRTWFDRVTNW